MPLESAGIIPTQFTTVPNSEINGQRDATMIPITRASCVGTSSVAEFDRRTDVTRPANSHKKRREPTDYFSASNCLATVNSGLSPSAKLASSTSF
jgi:hypothetical protein